MFKIHLGILFFILLIFILNSTSNALINSSKPSMNSIAEIVSNEVKSNQFLESPNFGEMPLKRKKRIPLLVAIGIGATIAGTAYYRKHKKYKKEKKRTKILKRRLWEYYGDDYYEDYEPKKRPKYDNESEADYDDKFDESGMVNDENYGRGGYGRGGKRANGRPQQKRGRNHVGDNLHSKQPQSAGGSNTHPSNGHRGTNSQHPIPNGGGGGNHSHPQQNQQQHQNQQQQQPAGGGGGFGQKLYDNLPDVRNGVRNGANALKSVLPNSVPNIGGAMPNLQNVGNQAMNAGSAALNALGGVASGAVNGLSSLLGGGGGGNGPTNGQANPGGQPPPQVAPQNPPVNSPNPSGGGGSPPQNNSPPTNPSNPAGSGGQPQPSP